jgi:thiol-disulfide isomerase/thioredoxin
MNKYGFDALTKTSISDTKNALFATAILYLVLEDMNNFMIYAQRLKSLYPASLELLKLNELSLKRYSSPLISNPIEFVKSNPYSAYTDFFREFVIGSSYNFSFDFVMKIHEHFSREHGVKSWKDFAKKTEIFAEFKMYDSAYFRNKEIIDAKLSGKLSAYLIGTLDTLYLCQASFDCAIYEYNNKEYNKALSSVLLPYTLYRDNFKNLAGIADNFYLYAEKKIEIHEDLGQKDSVLNVLCDIFRLTKDEAAFERIQNYYLTYNDTISFENFVKENKLETKSSFLKYAPIANFKISGNDENINLMDLKGKVVVLNFWGTYCKPCIKEMPELNDIKTKFSQEKDVIFIAPTKDNAEKLKSFFKSKKFDYQIAYAAEDVFKAFNVSFIPVNIVINRNGEIIFEEAGAYKDTHLKLNRAIEEALYAR